MIQTLSIPAGYAYKSSNPACVLHLQGNQAIIYEGDDIPVDNTDMSTVYTAIINSIVAIKDMLPYRVNITSVLTDAIASCGSKGKITIPPGMFYITQTIDVPSGIHVEGAGVRRRFYYASTAQNVTENKGGTALIVASGITAFKSVLRNRDQKISNMSIYAENGEKSVYGASPGFVANTNGIDITQSEEFVVEYLDFFGLDKCIFNDTISGVQETARPRVNEVIAQDCNYLVKLVDGAADTLISNIPIALHCNYFFYFESVDGVQIDNCRLYQSNQNSIYIDDCQFVSIGNVVFFETGETQCIIKNSEWITMSSVTFARAGWYHSSIEAKKAVVINNCDNVAIQGIIERPGGKALEIVDCNTFSFSGNIYNSFNGTGNATTGSITVDTSIHVNLNGSVKCDYVASKYALTCDRESRDEISGNITTNGLFNNTMNVQSNRLVKKVYVNGTTGIPAGGNSTLGKLRVVIPAGKQLLVTYMEYSSNNGLTGRIDSIFFLDITTEGGLVYTNTLQNIYDNRGNSTDYVFTGTVYLYNPTGGTISPDDAAEITFMFKLVGYT
jgi:hypothetical protein